MAYANLSVPEENVACHLQPHHPNGGQDRYVCEAESGLFGVFDGIGGTTDGAVAADIAAETISNLELDLEEFYSIDEVKETLFEALKDVNEKIRKQEVDTGTTATVVLALKGDEDFYTLVYASVGDSRLYVFQGGEVAQVTEDEGRGPMLYNALTGSLNDQVVQIDHIEIDPGDTVMLCTDGITGDRPSELLSDATLADALQYEPEEAAAKLIEASTKKDDKAVIVVRV